MTQELPPARPDHLPERLEFRRNTRYKRPKRLLSFWSLFFGLLIGVGGGLYYAWNIAPLEEFDTRPRQLSPRAKADYMVAIVLQFQRDSDLNAAVERLIALDVGRDPLQAVADAACDLARSGYVDSNAGLRAVRAMKVFYQLQGRSGCADTLIPDVVPSTQIVEIDVPTATPTLPPPPSKTPTPRDNVTPTPRGVVVVPTTPPQRTYEGRVVNTYCNTELSGLIEVFVRAFDGDGVPGEPIRVKWDEGEDTFISGLKPERGPSYADFQMQSGRGYVIDMPGLSNPVRNPLVAERCFTEDGEEAITSYYVVFQRSG